MELVYLLANTVPRFLTWRIVVVHSNREVPRHVGDWVPPLDCEVDTRVLIIQLRKEKTQQGIIIMWNSMKTDDMRKKQILKFYFLF